MIKLRSLIIVFLVIAINHNAGDAISADRRISGAIVKISCGDATNFSLRLSNRAIISGACMEAWCEALCGARMETARQRIMGKKISASVRMVNMEEEEEGVLSNEFYNINLEK